MVVTPGGVELSLVEQPSASETHQFEYDSATTGAGTAVVAALSEVLETDPMTMEPLQATVDVDALDTLFAGSDTVEATLSIAQHTVTLTGDGMITVRPASGPTAPK